MIAEPNIQHIRPLRFACLQREEIAASREPFLDHHPIKSEVHAFGGHGMLRKLAIRCVSRRRERLDALVNAITQDFPVLIEPAMHFDSVSMPWVN